MIIESSLRDLPLRTQKLSLLPRKSLCLVFTDQERMTAHTPYNRKPNKKNEKYTLNIPVSPPYTIIIFGRSLETITRIIVH